MNQRSRYFDNSAPNRIRTQIVNDYDDGTTSFGQTIPTNGQNQFEDMPLILLLDSGTSFDDGQLLTFTYLDDIDDPNISGFTGAATGATNQYGTQGITGTFTNNLSTYVTKQISYIDPDENLQTVNLQLVSLASGNSYNFKSGVEYFQVITTKTIAEAKDLLVNYGSTGSSILHKHIYMNTRRGCGAGSPLIQKPIEMYEDSDDLVLAFLVRGVDPYSPRQTIRYDLSKLFGSSSYGISDFQFEGEYFLNIPIQKVHSNFANGSHFTPEYHYGFNGSEFNDRDNGPLNNNKLFHTSFLFTPDSNQFIPFNSNAPTMYSSINYDIASELQNSNGRTISSGGLEIGLGGGSQGRIDGASYQYSLVPPNIPVILNSNSTPYDILTVSPSYRSIGSTTANTIMDDSTKIVFRSDRLPTSTGRDLPLSNFFTDLQDFALHLNNNFEIFTVSDNGEGVNTYPVDGLTATDSSGNLQDLQEEIQTGLLENGVLDSFTCPGLVAFDCYEGDGATFAVNEDCKDKVKDRVVNGCYVFVKSPLVASIFADFKYFTEWRTRIRFMFAACRGVISHLFQNNWVNGTLYMPSFQKRTFFGTDNEVRRYKFCGDPNQNRFGMFFSDRTFKGPIYFNTDTNSFFYRSAPYHDGQFKPQKSFDIPGGNDGQMWQPTTIMDLGPKTEFLKEIMLTPEFESFLVNTIKSTSYQDISGILNLFIISRLVNSKFFAQLLGLGDASIQKIFSRQDSTVNRFFDSRIDGDYAQLISINSEYGVIPYLDNNYLDSITVGEVIGIWFDSEEELRREMGPGEITIGPVTSQFDYVSSQEVPFYGWQTEDNTLFGTELNKWVTDKFITAKYQDETFDGSLTDYPRTYLGNGYGYLYNENTQFAELDEKAPNSDYYRVGSPFHFYFGLKRGKSALNRFIKKFVIIQD